MPKLFLLLLGATPANRNIEQHDVFLGIADSLNELIPSVEKFWPEAIPKLHIDAWREVRQVNGHTITVINKRDENQQQELRLFFINLGGYKRNEFEEFHYKMLVAASNKGDAITIAKQTAFFKHTHFEGANSHIDDKYGIDVDDIFEIRDILSEEDKAKYQLVVTRNEEDLPEDEIHLGYFKLSSFK